MARRAHEASREGPSPGQTTLGLLATFLIVLTAAGLLVLSVPRLVAGLALLPANAIKEAWTPRLYSDNRVQVPDATIRQWRASLDDANQWVESTDVWRDLSLVSTVEIRSTRDHDAISRLRQQARDEIEHALVLDAADGLAWIRLAQLRASGGEGRDKVLEAIVNSIAVAPYEPSALRHRLVMGLTYWNQAGPAFHAMIEDQMIYLAYTHQWDLLEFIVRRFPERLPDLRAGLAQSDKAERILRRAAAEMNLDMHE